MTLGEQIRQVRRNRGMTQKELGMRLGCPENSADVRIAQYETGHRMPKKERLEAIAKVLEVNPEIFCRRSPDSEKELMKMLLWMMRLTGNGYRLAIRRKWKREVSFWSLQKKRFRNF